MDVKILEEIPVLDQAGFPQLPTIDEDSRLLVFGTQWANAEKEYVAGIVVSACIEAKQWQAVSAKVFGTHLFAHPMIFDKQGVVNAMWKLVEENQLEIIQVGDFQYILPTIEFAKTALAESNGFRTI